MELNEQQKQIGDLVGQPQSQNGITKNYLWLYRSNDRHLCIPKSVWYNLTGRLNKNH